MRDPCREAVLSPVGHDACKEIPPPTRIRCALAQGTTTRASPASMLAEHLAKPARLTGELIAPRVVKPTKLEVETSNGWIKVPTTAML